MIVRARALLLVLTLVCIGSLLVGCGTIGDGERGWGPRPYGGVQYDLGDQRGCVRVPFWIAIWDVPFSLVLDTLILPYTIFCEPQLDTQPEAR